MTNQEIIDRGQTIYAEQTIGANTNVRVGEVVKGIGANLASEETARQQADTSLQQQISNEISAREHGESTLQSMIQQEAVTRENTDTTLLNKINGEISDRQEADEALQVNIDAEAEARRSAVDHLEDTIDNETSAREHADSTLNGLISSERSARQQADATLQSNIEAETTARANAINSEVAARQSADAALQDNIDSETTARETSVSNEASARQQADETLQSNIDAEVSARQTAVSDEAAARQNADTALGNAINDEMAARQSSDTALQQSIEDNAADIGNAFANIGYYVCDTAADTAEKTIAAPNYVIQTGGNIRIKMTNANTADNATLNINGVGAKALFYNGEQASSSNSWEADEVLTVYYDGTQFQAAVVSGGGKFATGENVDEASIYSQESELAELSDEQKALMIPNAKAIEEGFEYGESILAEYDDDGMTVGILLVAGTINTSFTNYKTSPQIAIASGATMIHTVGLSPNNSNAYIGFVFYDEDNTALGAVCSSGSAIPATLNLSDYPTAASFRYCCSSTGSPLVTVAKKGTIKSYFSDLQGEIEDLQDDMTYGSVLSATYDADGMESGKLLGVNGGLSNNSNYKTSSIIALPDDILTIETSGLEKNNAGVYIGFLLYDANQSILPLVVSSGESIPGSIDIATNYPSAKYMRYCCSTSSTPSVKVYVSGTLKSAVDELQGVKPLAEMVTTSIESHGDKFVNGGTYANQPLWFTQQDCAAESDGILKTIWFYAPDTGEYEFAVALLDQNSTAVNERFFTLTFDTVGVHEVDVFDMNIRINAGEQVFAHFRSTLRISLLSSSSTVTSALFAAAFTNEYKKGWTYGAEAGLAWSIVNIDSPFALKADIEDLETEIDNLQQVTSNIGYVVTQTGDKYRMTVVNGEIALLSTQYSKVLALGNSLTNHGLKTSIGWYGDGFAMAASRSITGWTNQLQRILRQKNENAVVNSINIAAWEVNASTNLSTLLDSVLDADVDCIIFRAGENAHPTDSSAWAANIKTLLTYCVTKCPNASLILSTCMWPNTLKDQAIAKVAVDWGLPLIYPGTGSNLERLGDYTEGSDSELHKITDNGVANHVNDVGFLKFANKLASSFGYEELDERHDVTVVDNNSIGYTCFSNWVANGIFNIHTTATTVTAVDGNGSSLTVTDHGDGVFTFVMPDSDVTITIS